MNAVFNGHAGGISGSVETNCPLTCGLCSTAAPDIVLPGVTVASNGGGDDDDDGGAATAGAVIAVLIVLAVSDLTRLPCCGMRV